MSPEIVAIVPIKDHSERLPNKNFRDFNGRPLYHWILKTLEKIDTIDKIVVDTNADEVIETGAELFDVEISERPERFYGDRTTRNIIEYEVERIDADLYVQTYCTNPLLRTETIEDALSQFLSDDDSDSLFTVLRHQSLFYDHELEPINHDPQEATPFQDLPPVYEDMGNMFIYTREAFEKTRHRVGENPMTYELGEIEGMDIDNKDDFEMAEYFHKRREMDA